MSLARMERSKRKAVQKRLGEADRLMGLGARSDGHAILRRLQEDPALSVGTYGDIVNIYLLGAMHSEARAAIARCKTVTGEVPPLDFSLEEIEAEERDDAAVAADYSRADRKVFKRMSILERGAPGSGFPFSPLREIVITEDDITLVRGQKRHCYGWKDIDSAQTISKEKQGRWGPEIRIRMVLAAPDRKFALDVSAQCPDFRHNRILLSELKKHLTIEHGALKKRIPARDWLVIMAALMAALISILVERYRHGDL